MALNFNPEKDGEIICTDHCYAIRRNDSQMVEVWDEDREIKIGSFFYHQDHVMNAHLAQSIHYAFTKGVVEGVVIGADNVRQQLQKVIFGKKEEGNA